MIDLENLKNTFTSLYGETGGNISIHFAPGRVNLIGEHTDYNGGYVLPCALTFGTYLLSRPNESQRFRFSSLSFPGNFDLSMQELQLPRDNAWVNYPLGVFDQFLKTGQRFEGMDLLFFGDIPLGAGLSSSASIELATALAINDHFSLGYDKVGLAGLCQRAENQFVGMNCGIMDQFASALSEKDHALFLNCATLNYVNVPFVLDNVSLIIANTNKKRGLVDTKYNERRRQCESAVEYLRKERPINFLGQLHQKDFEKLSHLITDDTVLKRARHVVAEDMRVLEAAKALHIKDMTTFGKIMLASHASLRDDFEVSCFELDVLVEEAEKIPATLGSRMTGGGFGGCTISLVKTGYNELFIRSVGEQYQRRTGLLADFYIVDTGNGACRIS